LLLLSGLLAHLRLLLQVLLGNEILDSPSIWLGLARLLVHRIKASEPSDAAESIVLLLGLELRLLLLYLLVNVLLLLLQVS
jgi:hypothetical protein